MGGIGWGRLAGAVVVALALVCAPAALASTTTIGFDDLSPGDALGAQYLNNDGVQFSPPSDQKPPAAMWPASSLPVSSGCGGYTKSDPTNAHSSPNVAYSFCPNDYANENLYNPNGGWEGFEGRLSTLTTTVSVYAGAPGGKIQEFCCVDTYAAGGLSVELEAYNANEDVIATDTKTVGQKADTLLTVNAPSAEIAYFTISGPSDISDGAPLEIDDLSFEVPAAPPPPAIGITAPNPAQGYPGATVSVPVTVQRFNGADDAITLSVSDLPTGVTLISGGTVGASSTSTTLKFAIAPGAPAGTKQYLINAATADASAPPAQTGSFSVDVPTFTNPQIGISVAQAAGDPAQLGANGASVSYDGVPLVAGHATLVRVFADPVGLLAPGTSGLTATLSGSSDGKPLPGSPLLPDQGGPTALGASSFTTQLGEEDTSFNFLLPSSWTTGNVTLTAGVVGPMTPSPTVASCASGCFQSMSVTGVKFTQMPTFELTPVAIDFSNGGQTISPPSNPEAALALAYETLPAHKVVLDTSYTGTINVADLDNPPAVNGKPQSADNVVETAIDKWVVNQFTSDGNVNEFHRLVLAEVNGVVNGDTSYDFNVGTNANGTAIYEPVAEADTQREISSIAHEMGHGIDRRHADTELGSSGCGGPGGGGSDADWPDEVGHLEPTTNFANGAASPATSSPVGQSYGVNLAWRVPEPSGTGPFVIFPDSDYDFMSYCAGTPDYQNTPTASNPETDWISPRGWQQEFECLKSGAPNADCPVDEENPNATVGGTPDPTESGNGTISGSADVAAADPTATAAGPAIRGPSIWVGGYIDPGGTLVSPALMPATNGDIGARKSPYTATLVNAAGKVVVTTPLSMELTHIEHGPKTAAIPQVSIEGFLPTHGETVAGLTLRAAGKVLERIKAPAHAPRVTVSTPRLRRGATTLTLRWNSHDKSRATRTAFVSFSTGGRRWTTIWEGTDKGHIKIALATFGRARRIRLRVSVNDGFVASVATTRRVRLPAVKASKANAGPPPAWLVELERDGIVPVYR